MFQTQEAKWEAYLLFQDWHVVNLFSGFVKLPCKQSTAPPDSLFAISSLLWR